MWFFTEGREFKLESMAWDVFRTYVTCPWGVRFHSGSAMMNATLTSILFQQWWMHFDMSCVIKRRTNPAREARQNHQLHRPYHYSVYHIPSGLFAGTGSLARIRSGQRAIGKSNNVVDKWSTFIHLVIILVTMISIMARWFTRDNAELWGRYSAHIPTAYSWRWCQSVLQKPCHEWNALKKKKKKKQICLLECTPTYTKHCQCSGAQSLCPELHRSRCNQRFLASEDLWWQGLISLNIHKGPSSSIGNMVQIVQHDMRDKILNISS